VKKRGLLLAFIFVVYSVFVLFSDIGAWTADYSYTYSRFRLNVVALRGGADVSSPAQVSVSDFGLLLDGCNLDLKPEYLRNATTIDLLFPHQVTMNGWYFHTSNRDPALDPTTFEVLASDNDEDWKRIGSSSMEGGDALPPNTWTLPQQRLRRVDFFIAPQWQWCVRNVVMGCVWVVHWATVLVLGWLCVGADLMQYQWVLFAVMCAVCGFLASFTPDQTAFMRSVCSGLLHVALISAVVFESYFGPMFGFLGASSLSIGLWAHLTLYKGTWSVVINYIGAGAVILGVTLLSYLLHFRIRRKADQLIRPDMDMYDRCWDELLGQQGVPEALAALAATAGVIATEQAGAKVVQMQRKSDREEILELLGWTERSLTQQATLHCERAWARWRRGREEWPARSLSQLFVHAEYLQRLLIQRVQEWAGVAGGSFKLATGGYVRWVQASGIERRGIAWAKIKSLSRSVEKTMRVYHGDVSRLVDICRQSIYFDRVQDVQTCLQLMATQDQVKIVRIKNRLDTAYRSTASGGYRDLCINLRIVTEETEAVGVDHHIVEVQLLLKAFADLKHEDGHRRYIAFRNLRGE